MIPLGEREREGSQYIVERMQFHRGPLEGSREHIVQSHPPVGEELRHLSPKFLSLGNGPICEGQLQAPPACKTHKNPQTEKHIVIENKVSS